MAGQAACQAAMLPRRLIQCPGDPTGHRCTLQAGHVDQHVCTCGVVFTLGLRSPAPG
jgi:hypothetical protein